MSTVPDGNRRDHSLMVLARNCIRATQQKLSDLREAAPRSGSLHPALVAGVTGRPSVERVEECFDEFVASVLRIWCQTLGPPLERNFFVELIQARPLAEISPLIAVGFIMGTLYISFRFAYLPAMHLPFGSTSSVIFHSSFVLAVLSYERGVTVDPGSIPENWRKAENGRPRFELEGGRIFIYERKKKNRQLRFCNKEMKFKPDRAHYCRITGRNVLRMDHYCLYLANCVGYHNHKYFFLFLFYTLIATGTLDVGVLRALFFHTHTAGHTFMMAQGAMVSSVIAAFLGPFFAFHCWLMRHNMTTIEYCEKMREDTEDSSSLRASHYDIGLFRNIQSVMGDNWMLWLLPINGPAGDGLQWGIAEQKKSEAAGSVGPADLPPEAQEEDAEDGVEATDEYFAEAEAAEASASGQSASSSADPWVSAAQFKAPPCVYQAGHALQEICGSMAEYYQRIRDEDTRWDTRLPGMGLFKDFKGRFSSTAAEPGAEDVGDRADPEAEDRSESSASSMATDVWAAFSSLAAQSRHCVAQSRCCPQFVPPAAVYGAGETLQEMCGDISAYMETKARAVGILPSPGLMRSVVPKQRASSSQAKQVRA